MKDALLWKRILDEGIGSAAGGNPRISEELTATVIGATTITDNRPMREPPRWDEFSHLPVPFTKFWVEGPGIEDDRWGAHVSTVELAGERKKLDCHCVMTSQDHGPSRLGHFQFVLDNEGNPVGVPTMIIGRAEANRHGVDRAEMLVNGIGSMVMDTLMILGCKNISLKPNEIEPKAARRAAKRHGGTPDSYRYHTLVVRPPGAKSDAEAQDLGTMPRHICRGHFAEYGPEFNKGLLFGRYAGRFFIPPHMKGDKRNGIVEKDYSVPSAVNPR